MQFYVASPTRKPDATHEAFRFDVSSMVCSTVPVKFVVTGENAYTSLMTIDMNDADLDLMIEKAIEARDKRKVQKAGALTMLAESEYDAGALSMETAERLQYLSSAVLADATDTE